MNKHVKAAVAEGFLPSRRPEQEARDYWQGLDAHERHGLVNVLHIETEDEFVEVCMDEMRAQRAHLTAQFDDHTGNSIVFVDGDIV